MNTTVLNFSTAKDLSWMMILKKKSKILFLRQIDVNSHITHDQIGMCREADENALDPYADFLVGTTDFSLQGMKVVLDCANGAAYKVAQKGLQKLGANVVAIGVSPNGTNINDGCGSTHPEQLQEAVVREGALSVWPSMEMQTD